MCSKMIHRGFLQTVLWKKTFPDSCVLDCLFQRFGSFSVRRPWRRSRNSLLGCFHGFLHVLGSESHIQLEFITISLHSGSNENSHPRLFTVPIRLIIIIIIITTSSHPVQQYVRSIEKCFKREVFKVLEEESRSSQSSSFGFC